MYIFIILELAMKIKVLTFYSPSSSSALFTMEKENLEKFKLHNEIVNEVEIQTYKIETLFKKFS